MSPTLEDQERHLLVKVIDRVLYKLDDLVRPFVHKVSEWWVWFGASHPVFSHDSVVATCLEE